ncbi:hypothetical protein [Nonomuraea sp. NPDC049504]|uniref:hypothetical protein n=1 Tax=Nonomuraea sp. NPDC049504 TaxID=3154729 RepID=UPI003437C98D
MTGGVPPLTATAGEVYARLYPRVAAKNAALYRRHPEDVDRVRRIADHLAAHDVRLPDGDRLGVARFRSPGKMLGSGDGLERLHWLLEDAWHGDDLSDSFRYAVMTATGFVEGPLSRCRSTSTVPPGRPTGWAAEEELARHPRFAADADPMLFTGAMMYRWMFAEIRALRPFAGAADLRGAGHAAAFLAVQRLRRRLALPRHLYAAIAGQPKPVCLRRPDDVVNGLLARRSRAWGVPSWAGCGS